MRRAGISALTEDEQRSGLQLSPKLDHSYVSIAAPSISRDRVQALSDTLGNFTWAIIGLIAAVLLGVLPSNICATARFLTLFQSSYPLAKVPGHNLHIRVS